MYGMQTEKLRYFQKQKERPRQNRDQKVLQILPEAYRPQGR